MAADFHKLVKDPVFLFKGLDFLLSCYAFVTIYNHGFVSNFNENLIVYLAIPGAAIATLILMGSYIFEDKNENFGRAFLLIYGWLNVAACYVFYTKSETIKNQCVFIKPPMNYNTILCGITGIVGLAMLTEFVCLMRGKKDDGDGGNKAGGSKDSKKDDGKGSKDSKKRESDEGGGSFHSATEDWKCSRWTRHSNPRRSARNGPGNNRLIWSSGREQVSMRLC